MPKFSTDAPTPEEESRFHLVLRWALGLAFFCLAWETYNPTPYGKFVGTWSFQVNPRLGWFLLEFPCWIVFTLVFWLRLDGTSKPRNKAQLVLACIYTMHYVYRGMIFPARIAVTPGSGFALFGAVGGWLVTITHGYLNAAWIGRFGRFQNSYLGSVQFWLGVVVYYSGLYFIVQLDNIMRELRSNPDAPRYQIPHGSLWDYSTSAQYFAELWAWMGWWIINGGPTSGPNGAFIFFVSLFNLVPRAVTNYNWYVAKFGDEFVQLDRAKLVPYVW